MDNHPREHEVEWRTAAFGDHGVEQIAEGATTDEEREALVLVRRPGPQEPAEDAGKSGGQDRRRGPEEVDLLRARARTCEGEGAGRDFVHEELVSNATEADSVASVFSTRAYL